MARGTRESTWLVARRCLAIIRRVQRGPATREELVQAVLAAEGEDAYDGARGERLKSKVEKDLIRIRDRLYVDVYYDRQAGGYVIKDTWLPLLDLPDEDLATIAWLEQTFSPESPQHDEVHALLGRLRFYLGLERRREIMRQREQVAIDLARRDDDSISPGVEAKLEDALHRRVRVAFDYYAPGRPDEEPRRHTVAPYERYFKRGHEYLHGYCYAIEGPEGRHAPGAYYTYRLGRIANVQVLSQKLPPTPPPARRYDVVYELAPVIAQGGVSSHHAIEIQAVEERDDGSALVRGTTTDLFAAVQALMRYRHNCRVVGGPAMVQRMEEVVRKMAELYGVVESSGSRLVESSFDRV